MPLGGVLVLMLSASVGTSSTAPEAGLEGLDDALSEEDLALMAELEAETPTVAEVVERPPPVLRVFEGLSESAPRSLGHALDRRPTRLMFRADHPGNDVPFLRGRTGHRVGLRLDGVTLHHPLTSIRDLSVFGLVEPFDVRAVTIERDLDLQSQFLGADDRHAGRSEIRVMGRTADRSATAHGAVTIGRENAALRMSATHGEFNAVRLGANAGVPEAPAGHQRHGMSLRGAVFDDAGEMTVTAGADFSRQLNLLRPDLGRFYIDTRDTVRERALTFARVDVLQGKLRGAGHVAYQVHQFRRVTLVDDLRDRRLSTVSRQVSGTLDLAIALDERIEFGGVAHGALGDADFRTVTAGGARDEGGSLSRIDAVGFGRYTTETFEARADVGLVRGESSFQDRNVSSSQLVTHGRAEYRPTDQFLLEGGWSRNVVFPSVMDLSQGDLRPETNTTLELGAGVEHSKIAARLVGFVNFVGSPIERRGDQLVNGTESGRIAGVETELTWRATERLSILGAASYLSSSNLTEVPGLLGRLHFRYDFGRKLTFVELTSRLTAPPTSDPGHAVVRLGARGGLYLGAGFALGLVFDNLLDSTQVRYLSRVPESGVDARLMLTHRWGS